MLTWTLGQLLTMFYRAKTQALKKMTVNMVGLAAKTAEGRRRMLKKRYVHPFLHVGSGHC